MATSATQKPRTRLPQLLRHLPFTFFPEFATCRLQSSQYHFTDRVSGRVVRRLGPMALTILGRTPQTNTLQVEPFDLAFLAVAPHHLAKRYPIAVAISGLVRVINVHLILLQAARVLICFLLLCQSLLDCCRVRRGRPLLMTSFRYCGCFRVP